VENRVSDDRRAALSKRIDTIESGYEFMLAYAAQGHETDATAGPNQNIRQYLTDMATALDGLGAIATAVAESLQANKVDTYRAFLQALEADANNAQAAVKLVLAQKAISSQLIDNLNATIHVRALLTDLFLIDEAFK
jgi:alkylation response protein AidB-like acyl-CoA dehydrogenase